MTTKVSYPTQIIPTTTHYQWRKAILAAEEAALVPANDAEQRAYYFSQRDALKAEYADWRKAQREETRVAKLIRFQWQPKNWAKLDALFEAQKEAAK